MAKRWDMEAQALVAAAAISLESCKREGRRAESLERERRCGCNWEWGDFRFLLGRLVFSEAGLFRGPPLYVSIYRHSFLEWSISVDQFWKASIPIPSPKTNKTTYDVHALFLGDCPIFTTSRNQKSSPEIVFVVVLCSPTLRAIINSLPILLPRMEMIVWGGGEIGVCVPQS
jgi:hypothetical protein